VSTYISDTDLEQRFRAWWTQSYPTLPGVHALNTHLGWARFLLEQVQEQQRREVQR
jgi:hypothetical protein